MPSRQTLTIVASVEMYVATVVHVKTVAASVLMELTRQILEGITLTVVPVGILAL